MQNNDLIYIQGQSFYKEEDNDINSIMLCELCGKLIDSDSENHICQTIKLDEE